jgi:glycine cleavage system protein P-like pyridoxal-binding family
MPPSKDCATEMDMYARFMRHLRCVPTSRMEIKILSAIQFTADMLDLSDAHVSKVLVDLGLRAPRMAFPADFLRHIDQSLLREGYEVGAPSPSMKVLKDYWDHIGEDKFAAFRGPVAVVEDTVFT